MDIELQNVVFACPGNTPESYERGGRSLASFYAKLLGLRLAREDWFVLEDEDDLDDAERRALELGASRLQDNGSFRSYADPDGHPFCLYRDAAQDPTGRTRLGRIDRVVVDCFSPRALADFYAALLDMPRRELDTPERVVIARSDGRLPALAFQHAQFPAPRWPDPAYPQQVHLDLRVLDPEPPRVLAARDRAEQLGAIRLTDKEDTRQVYADPAGHPFCL